MKIIQTILFQIVLGIAFLAAACPFYASAAPGDLDSSFDAGSGLNDAVFAVAALPDGKLVIGGQFTTVRGLVRHGIARLNADGSGDPGFDAGAGVNGRVLSILAQPDGKLLIGGEFTSVDGTSRNRIARLHPDGNLDTSFNPGVQPGWEHFGTGANGTVGSIAVQPDGKILIGGSFFRVNGVSRIRIARFHPDGSLDTSFQPGTGADNWVSSIVALEDGKVLIGGDFTTVDDTSRNGIARLHADGSLDFSFDPGTGVKDWGWNGDWDLSLGPGRLYSIVVQPDGKVLIGGNFELFNGVGRNRIARLHANGGLDEGFDPGMVGVADRGSVNSIVLKPDGKILITVFFDSINGVSRNGIALLHHDGGLDPGFNPDPGLFSGFGMPMTMQADGKIVVGSRRLHADGTLDSSFQVVVAITDGRVFVVAAKQDGKVLIGGDFTSIQGTKRSAIALLNPDGSLNPAFNSNLEVSGWEIGFPVVLSIAVQSDGKMLIGGGFASINSTSRRSIARLNADGSLDSSFNPGTGADGWVMSIVVQSDGKVLIGGQFTTINGVTRNGIARLNANGTLDGTFNPGSGIGDEFAVVQAIIQQTDGKILLGGDFVSVNGVTRWGIARLHVNGSLDTGFNPGMNGRINCFAKQSDGKVLLGGEFTTINGISRNGIARLNVNGTVDSSFTSAMAAGSEINSIVVQPDDQVLIAGAFANGIARLNPDGTLDASFNTARTFTGEPSSNPLGIPQGPVASMALQPDGNVLIGGYFNSVNQFSRWKIARLHGSNSALPISLLGTVTGGDFQLSFSGDSNATYTMMGSSNLVNWTELGAAIQTAPGQFEFTDPGVSNRPAMFYQVRSP